VVVYGNNAPKPTQGKGREGKGRGVGNDCGVAKALLIPRWASHLARFPQLPESRFGLYLFFSFWVIANSPSFGEFCAAASQVKPSQPGNVSRI